VSNFICVERSVDPDLGWNRCWFGRLVDEAFGMDAIGGIENGLALFEKGSVYAEMQSWSINVETGEASFDPHGGRRLVGKKNTSLDVNAIAEEIYELVAAKNPHAWLKWNGSTEVKILVGKVLPSEHIPQETLRGRRRRFGLAVDKILVEHGWEKIGLHQFKQR
jgi:hypothetical protein